MIAYFSFNQVPTIVVLAWIILFIHIQMGPVIKISSYFKSTPELRFNKIEVLRTQAGKIKQVPISFFVLSIIFRARTSCVSTIITSRIRTLQCKDEVFELLGQRSLGRALTILFNNRAQGRYIRITFQVSLKSQYALNR